MFSNIFPNGREFLVQILHTYYSFISMLVYKFLSNYLQFWLSSYAVSSPTTEFIPYVQNVNHRPTHMLAFSDIFPNSWEFWVQILHTYYTFLSTLDYKFHSR